MHSLIEILTPPPSPFKWLMKKDAVILNKLHMSRSWGGSQGAGSGLPFPLENSNSLNLNSKISENMPQFPPGNLNIPWIPPR